jgi:hypothetical protein
MDVPYTLKLSCNQTVSYVAKIGPRWSHDTVLVSMAQYDLPTTSKVFVFGVPG